MPLPEIDHIVSYDMCGARSKAARSNFFAQNVKIIILLRGSSNNSCRQHWVVTTLGLQVFRNEAEGEKRDMELCSSRLQLVVVPQYPRHTTLQHLRNSDPIKLFGGGYAFEGPGNWRMHRYVTGCVQSSCQVSVLWLIRRMGSSCSARGSNL